MTITLVTLLNKLCRSSRPEVSIKKGDLETFAKFTEKYLCQSFSEWVPCSTLQLYWKRASGTTLLKKGLLWILWNSQEHLFYWTALDDCIWPFQNPFLWLFVYHFVTLLETWMFIQCSTDFRLWTVAKYISDWVFFEHIICFVTI